MKPSETHAFVRAGYEKAAQAAGCCGATPNQTEHAIRIGYTAEDVSSTEAGANLGLGCGNPTALAELRPGEVVLDLGSGAGFDALIAAPKLGPEGRFIGVDMTPEMLERARTNAVRAGHARTVEFREGLIEDLPVASGSVDVVISNCVINLSPDKGRVFREAFRVLKPGGRLAVSDIVLSEPLPEALQAVAATWVACLGGALPEAQYFDHLRAAGFTDVRYTRKPAAALFEGSKQEPMIQAAFAALGGARVRALADTVWSYAIEARKP